MVAPHRLAQRPDHRPAQRRHPRVRRQRACGTLFLGVEDDGEIVGLARGLSKRSEPLEQAMVAYQEEIRKRLQHNLKDNRSLLSAKMRA
jgi:hypothetical protein